MMSASVINYNNCFAEKWIRDLSPAEWRGKVDVEYVEVPISLLEHAGCWTDPDVVAGWVQTLERGGTIPPPVGVLTERGTYYLHDGNHRFEALQQFAAGADDTLVRLAVAKPLAGYRFALRGFDGYSTYILEREYRAIDKLGMAVMALMLSSLGLFMTAMVPGVDNSPFFVILVLSVLVSAWLGGWRAGILASLWSLTGAAYFIISPNRSLYIDRTEHLVQFVLLAVLMATGVFFMQYVRRHPTVTIPLSSLFERRNGG